MLGSKRIASRQKRSAQISEAKAEISTKAAAYLRVSTEEQAQHGHGLANQERALRAFATSQGYDLTHVVSDPGISGATRPDDRPGFAQLMDLAAQKAFSVLLVYKFDRLARNIVFAVTTVNDLSERFDVALRSVTEPLDTATPMGRMLFSILAGMAEAERQTITERTHGGRREKARKGGLACGAAPYGYRADGKALIIHEPEAEVVRRIFALRSDGLKLSDIADALNRDGIKAPRGGIWRKGRIQYLLDNPRYRGVAEYLFTWHGAEQHELKRGKHKAIVKP